jgi:predicted nucleic acid-binding protein
LRSNGAILGHDETNTTLACTQAAIELNRRFVEAMYHLSDLPLAQEALWEMLERGAVLLLPLDSSDIPRIRELKRKYACRPMDLAAAALLRVAERERLCKIFTVDRRDFSLDRLNNPTRPTLIP